MDGAGEADLRIEAKDPKEERRLWVMAGGFIGRAREVGVPGMEADGAGEAGATMHSADCRIFGSGGAGLLAEIRLAGKSILVTLLCCRSVNSPSLVLRL